MRWALAALALLGCEKVESNRPTPPRHDALLADYAAPSGKLGEASARDLIAALDDRLEDVEAVLALTGTVLSFPGVFGSLQETQAGPLRVQRSALRKDLGAWARITYRCPAAAAGDRGEIEAFALFEDGALEPTLWGAAKACLLAQAEGDPFVFDGDLWLHLEKPLEPLAGAVFLFDGVLDRAGEAAPLTLDLQLLNDHVVLRQPVGDEVFLIGFAFDDFSDLRLYDQSGEWRCDRARCSGPDGRRVEW